MAMGIHTPYSRTNEKSSHSKKGEVKSDIALKQSPAPTLEVINIEGCLSTTKVILM